MTERNREDLYDALSRAEKTIEQQDAELKSLRVKLANEQFAQQLSEALILTATAGAIAAPVTHSRLLELIVQNSMYVTSATHGALFLIDEEAQELIFEISLGPHAAEVKDVRVPLGHGIAGLVAATGEAMVVANAGQDPRHAADVAEVIGYSPKSILCVPLVYDDRVIGALEMLDKEGSHSFAQTDIEALGFFANQAAVAIEQSFAIRHASELITLSLSGLRGSAEEQKQKFREGAKLFGRHLEQEPLYIRALNLAVLVRELVECGACELRLCESILNDLIKYSRSKEAPMAPITEIGPNA